MEHGRLSLADVVRKIAVAGCLAGLLLQVCQLRIQGHQDVVQALEIGFRAPEPQFGLVAARVQAGDAGGFFQQLPPLNWLGGDHGADPALADAAGTLLDWQRLRDGAEFFRRQGYFEGADPPPVMFDAAWYMDFYPDVRLLIAQGAFPDALSHYMQRGRAEWRAPNARSLARVARWRDLIRQVDPR